MSISFNDLGRAGRFGNQLFQYAALRSIAKHRGLHWMIPGPDAVRPDNYGLFETFKMTNVKPNNLGFVNASSVEENDHCFSEEFFTKLPDNVNLNGYFQTEKYFSHIKDEILEDFTFHDDYYNPCKEYIDSLESEPIFLHIRRSDSIGREEYHPILPISYFEDALKKFPEDTPCFVFSDDVEWCKSQKIFEQDRFLFNESNGRYSARTKHMK